MMEQIVSLCADLYKLVLIAAAVISWIRVDPYHPVVQFVSRSTEPLFEKIREVVPRFNGIDFSPLVGFILVILVEKLLLMLI
jgi:YggT family protein